MIPKRIAIIGSGPSGLMAAEGILEHQKTTKYPPVEISIFERKSTLGRKILIAGSSGLNITYDLPELEEFFKFYRCNEILGRKILEQSLQDFTPRLWIDFVERLESKTFTGTSKRVLLKDAKAAHFLNRWTERLQTQGVQFLKSEEWTNLEIESNGRIRFKDKVYDACILATGSPSWDNHPSNWIPALKNLGIQIEPFESSNVGYELTPSLKPFLEECEGLPLKNVILKTSVGEKRGDLVATKYGLEGTPIYFVGTKGPALLNLRPDFSESEWLTRLQAHRPKRRLSALRFFRKYSGLSEASFSLVFHSASASERLSLVKLVRHSQNLKLELTQPRPLAEAISAKGGVLFSNLNPCLMLKNLPGVFVTGELLNWDAPTGGFLIQACVSLGKKAGICALDYVILKEWKN